MAPTFDERLHAPVTWWLLVAALGVTVWWTLVAAAPWGMAVGAGVLAAGLGGAGLWRWGSVRISVSDRELRAGRAAIPLHLCADATALEADATRAQRGPQADARAYLLLRPYVPTAVRVDLADPRDPTPYWLLSTRRPEELAAAVRAGSLRATD